jgi:hypothetical protein
MPGSRAAGSSTDRRGAGWNSGGMVLEPAVARAGSSTAIWMKRMASFSRCIARHPPLGMWQGRRRTPRTGKPMTRLATPISPCRCIPSWNRSMTCLPGQSQTSGCTSSSITRACTRCGCVTTRTHTGRATLHEHSHRHRSNPTARNFRHRGESRGTNDPET